MGASAVSARARAKDVARPKTEGFPPTEAVDLSGGKIEDLEPIKSSKTEAGVEFPKYFTARLEGGRTPYDEIQWETRNATIGNDKGSIIFEQRDVLVPADWSQTATNIVASKYFHW